MVGKKTKKTVTKYKSFRYRNKTEGKPMKLELNTNRLQSLRLLTSFLCSPEEAGTTKLGQNLQVQQILLILSTG